MKMKRAKRSMSDIFTRARLMHVCVFILARQDRQGIDDDKTSGDRKKENLALLLFLLCRLLFFCVGNNLG